MQNAFRLCVAFVFMVVACQCERQKRITKEAAVEIAKKECSRRNVIVQEIGNVKFFEDRWHVMVWFLPSGPGSDAIVSMKPDGSDVQWQRGW